MAEVTLWQAQLSQPADYVKVLAKFHRLVTRRVHRRMRRQEEQLILERERISPKYGLLTCRPCASARMNLIMYPLSSCRHARA